MKNQNSEVLVIKITLNKDMVGNLHADIDVDSSLAESFDSQKVDSSYIRFPMSESRFIAELLEEVTYQIYHLCEFGGELRILPVNRS